MTTYYTYRKLPITTYIPVYKFTRQPDDNELYATITLQVSPSQPRRLRLHLSFNIGCANVVNDISVVCADRRGGDGVGEAVVAIVAIDIGVNHDGPGAVGCAVIVIVIISVVVGGVSVVDIAVKVVVVVDPGGTSVVGNVIVIIVFAVFVVAVAGSSSSPTSPSSSSFSVRKDPASSVALS